MSGLEKIINGLKRAHKNGATAAQPSQQNHPLPDANYVVSDGQNTFNIHQGSSARLDPVPGRRYRVLRKRVVDGREVVEELDQAAVLRTSDAADSDLILQLDAKTRVAFKKFYSVCVEDQCGIELPTDAGGRIVIGVGTPVQAAYTKGGGLVFSLGDESHVLALTDSFSEWFGSTPIAHDALAGAASGYGSKLPLALLGLAAAGGGVAALATGGGGSGGGAGPGTDPGEGTGPDAGLVTVQGTVVAGPIIVDRVLKVSLFRADGTLIVGDIPVLLDGTFTTSFSKGYNGVIIAKLVDPDDAVDYLDEASNANKDIASDMRAVVNLVAGQNTLVLTISPLTELAARLLGLEVGDKGASSVVASGLTPDAVAGVDAVIQSAFGLTQPLASSAVPIVNSDGSVNPSANSIGLVLASISGLEALYNSSDPVSLLKAAFDSGNIDKATALLVAGAKTVDTAQGTSVLASLIASSAPLEAVQATVSSIEPNLSTADAAALKALSLAQVASLSDAAIASLSAAQVAALTPEQLSVLAPSALRHLDTSQVPSANLADLSLNQIKATYEGDAAPIGGLPQDAVLIAPVDEVSGEVASGVAPGVTLGLYNNGVRVATVPVAADGSWSVDTSGFTEVGTYNLVVKAEFPDGSSVPVTEPLVFQVKEVPELTPVDVPHVPVEQLINLDDTTLQSLTTEQLKSLTQDQVDALVTTKLDALTSAQITAIFAVQIKAALNSSGAAISDTGYVDDVTPVLTGVLHAEVPLQSNLKVVVYDVGNNSRVGVATLNGKSWSLQLVDPLSESTSQFIARIETDDASSYGDYSAPFTVTIDATAPEILSIIPQQTIVNTVNQSTFVTLVFSEKVYDLSLNDFEAPNGEVSALMADGSNPNVWTLIYTPHTNVEAAIKIALKDGSYIDRAGNVGQGLESAAITVDTKKPEGVITRSDAGAAIVTGENIVTYSVKFNDDVYSISDADLVVDGGSVVSFEEDNADPTNYILKVKVNSGASITALKVSLADGSYQDVNANPGLGYNATGIQVDNVAPVISTTSLSVAENSIDVGTLSAEDLTQVSWALNGSNGDNALFELTSSGELKFIAGQNFELPADVGGTQGDNIFVVSVKATDSFGLETTKAITVTLTNVNEAPTVSTPILSQSAIIGQDFNFTFDANAFIDPEHAALTYSATLADGSALPSWLTFNAAQRNFSATNVPESASPVTVRVTASDGSLTAFDDFDINPIAAPILTTTLGGATSFDVRSGIVISVNQDIIASSGGTITLTDLGGPGFHESRWRPLNNTPAPTTAEMVHTQTIDVTDSSMVRIVGTGADTKIIIYPEYQLDLASNYSLSISDGAFTSTLTGLDSAHFSTINFSTVTPNGINNGLANGTLSQVMNLDTGALEEGTKWIDFVGPNGQDIAGNKPAIFDVSGDAYVFAAKDLSTFEGNPVNRDLVIMDTSIKFINFGADDLIYIDNQANTAKNYRRIDGTNEFPDLPDEVLMDDYGYGIWKDYMFQMGLGKSDDPFWAMTQGESLNSEIFVVMDPDIILPPGYSNVNEYNSIPTTSQIFNVTRNGWSETGMLMSA